METQILGTEKYLWSSVLFTLVFVIWGWRIFDWIWLKPRKKERILRQQGFKGNSYTLMKVLFGDVKENSIEYAEALQKTINIDDVTVPRVMPFVHKTIERYGKMSFMWVGPRPRVLIMDPELMKTVMNKYNNFRKNFKVTNNIVQTLVKGILNLEGEEWSKSRKTLNPSFQLEKIKKMIPAFQASCDEFVNEWKNMVSSSKDGSCVVDVISHIETLTTKVVSQTLFASDYAKDKKVYKILKEMAAMARQTTRLLDLPGAKYLPTKTNRRSNQIMSELQKSLTSLINQRAEAIKAGKIMEDNFFHELLESELAEAHGIKNMDDLIGQVKLFYFAGYESTTTMLVWTMIFLSIHQNWQERARQEIFQVFGDRKPDYEGLSQLKIVTMILNEVLRLYPPIVELSRLVEEETKLGEYTIPADTLLMLPIIVLHRDTELWGEDANEFKPDRFAEGVLKATNGRPAFFPFGWGPRVCIGQNHALLEGKLVLANILRNFSFELAPTYKHAPYVIFTVQPQYGASIILRKLEGNLKKCTQP
ncbi:Cytochrome [Abeliophyllum distichum]|uniref:Cytochrome n=1 Tax=Abeliophyllum distichum TaxID=126358 RepID=A0ABD1T0N7_9LAMI